MMKGDLPLANAKPSPGAKMEQDEKRNKPRVNQCFLCKAWQLEKNLSPVEVPDQTGWVEKRACKKCLDSIFKEEG